MVREQYSLRRSDGILSLPDFEELSPFEFILYEAAVRHVLPPLIPIHPFTSFDP